MQEATLALNANVIEQQMPRIAQQIRVRQFRFSHRRASFLFFLGAALHLRFADQHRLAFELFKGLAQLKVLV